MWNVLYTDEFEMWWESLSADEQDQIAKGVDLLERFGPNLSRPYVDTVKGSRHSDMKELRTQCHGEPFRTFFAFDPERNAILLIGGVKKDDKYFYDEMIPMADNIYDEHLKNMKG